MVGTAGGVKMNGAKGTSQFGCTVRVQHFWASFECIAHPPEASAICHSLSSTLVSKPSSTNIPYALCKDKLQVAQQFAPMRIVVP